MAAQEPQGPGWWQASDGFWYPPEQHPDHQPEAPVAGKTQSGDAAEPGWWQAADGEWYPPEQHPDHRPSSAPPPAWQPTPEPGWEPPPTGTAPPSSKRGLLIAAVFGVAVLLVVAVVAVTRGDDEADLATTATEPTAVRSVEPLTDTTTTPPATAPTAVPPSDPTPAGEPTTEAIPAPTAVASTGNSPSPGGECRYSRLDDFGDMQVELFFDNTRSAPADLIIDYALSDGSGTRFLDSTVFVDVALPGERFRIEDDTITDLPDGITEAEITCRIIDTTEFGLASDEGPPGDGAFCRFVELDFADDIQIELTIVSPFDRITDVVVDYALRGPDGVRFVGSSAFVDDVGAGEQVRVDEDTLSDLPNWVPESSITCDILSIEPLS